jgi:hypothetical protein
MSPFQAVTARMGGVASEAVIRSEPLAMSNPPSALGNPVLWLRSKLSIIAFPPDGGFGILHTPRARAG